MVSEENSDAKPVSSRKMTASLYWKTRLRSAFLMLRPNEEAGKYLQLYKISFLKKGYRELFFS
jgi:hypothetical protein